MPIAQEAVIHHASGQEVLLPSDIIWLVKRQGTIPHFMRSSNGQAVGATFEDAFCQGLLEIIERDQLTLRRISLTKLGVYPPRCQLKDLPPSVEYLYQKCRAANLKLYLFYCTYDIHIPVYWAVLLDPSKDCPAFSGWGAAVQHEQAAARAILEAIQSRSVFIAGARDDIERRKFTSIDQDEVMRSAESQPQIRFPQDLVPEISVGGELRIVLSALWDWRKRIYYLDINLGDLHAVKAIVLGLECPAQDKLWRSMRWEKLYADHLRRTQSVPVPA